MKVSKIAKNFYPVLIIGVITISLTILMQCKLPAQNRRKPAIQTSPESSNSTGGTQVETSDWKSYQSSIMGFSIKYPSDWEVSPEHPDRGGLRVNFKSRDKDVWFSIIKSTHLDYEAMIESDRRLSEISIEAEEKQISIDNIPALVISYVRHWARAAEDVKTINVYVEDKNIWITIQIYGYSEDKGYKYSSIIHEMLSALRFEQ